MPRRARAKARDKRMNGYFDNIVKHVGIDYNIREIQDIHTAVFEMFHRISRRINERGVFIIARIQPGGSMAEKTSLWKSSKSTRYLEFDFLGVLERSCMLQTQENCPGCMKVNGVLVNTELLGRHGYIDNYTSFHSGEYIYKAPKLVDAIFKGEINSSIVSSCSCFRLIKVTLPSHNEYPFVIYTFYP